MNLSYSNIPQLGGMWPAFASFKSNPESARRLKLTRISVSQGTNFTDAGWKGARGINPVASREYDDPLSLALPGRSSRGHFPSTRSAG
jgi:hypothetical protein